MGGDSFQGTQKLTNQQYQILVPQILHILSDMYIRAQSYIPVPQKTIHGDIDFLMILKPNVSEKDIIQRLKIERFKLNNNHTINSVYKNKQADFCFKQSEQDYQIAKFYKSYSGFGAHLGLFLPSKQIRLSDSGLYALGYKQHIKVQFLITNSVPIILKFYGLDYQLYQKGFTTRKSLFQYLRTCRFLNQKKFMNHDCKNQSKLTKFFVQYLNTQTDLKDFEQTIFQNPKEDTLNQFKKLDQFKKYYENIINQFQKKQTLNKKFNATHIMQKFKIKPKQVNKLKQKFRQTFKDDNQYFIYVQQHILEQILQHFANVVDVGQKNQKKQNSQTNSQKQQQNKKCQTQKKQQKIQKQQIKIKRNHQNV